MDVRSEIAVLRRRRLIDATVEVLGEVGADRLTMDMVAERADAATRTVYNYFPTRQELLNAVQAELLEAFRERKIPLTPGDKRSTTCASSPRKSMSWKTRSKPMPVRPTKTRR